MQSKDILTLTFFFKNRATLANFDTPCVIDTLLICFIFAPDLLKNL